MSRASSWEGAWDVDLDEVQELVLSTLQLLGRDINSLTATPKASYYIDIDAIKDNAYFILYHIMIQCNIITLYVYIVSLKVT